MHVDRLMRVERRARYLSGPLVPKGGLKEPRRAQWHLAPPLKPQENEAIRAGGLVSGGRSRRFESCRVRRKSQGVETWQSSHLGGHRFAACVLWLPDGLMYGRLRAEHAPAFVRARQAGELGDMDLFRGRCAYDCPTQAAEIFLRRKLGEQDASAVALIESDSEDESTWVARFRTALGETSVRVRLEPTGIDAPASCGGEPEPVTRFVEL